MPRAQAPTNPEQLVGSLSAGLNDDVANDKRSPFPNDAYRVGWISALPIELAAARGMLDEEHGNPQALPQKVDNNTYVLGQIHNHKVVIACLPRGEVGASSAAIVARDMMWTFPNIRIGLMVGIGAGIPTCTPNEDDESADEDEEDIHLGDVVISSDKKTGGVVAYNFGKKLADGLFEVAYHLDQPPRVIRTTLANLEAAHEIRDNLIPKYIDQMLQNLSGKMRSKWTHPGLDKDLLFPPDYLHLNGKTCKNCDDNKALRKGSESREDNIPVIHYGVIATGSEVVRHAPTRDQIRSDHNAICLEMEAAGLMNNFPCVVIRGISDYADSHKNDRWHRYAAAAAAACAKELLGVAQPLEVEENPRAAEIVGLLDKIDGKLDNVQTKISTFVTAFQGEKLRKWLSAPNPETNFRAALGSYHPGTCLWFLDGEKFKDWKLASHRSLWMHGIPGSGKTVMSSKIIDGLFSDRTSVLYFFFDTRDSKKQGLDDLLRSLIFQLYTEGRSSDLLEGLFVDKFGEGLIVLDALDECSTKDDLLDWIQLSEPRPELENVSFLLTSRNDKLIESGIRRWLSQDHFVPLETDSINKDLTGYIEYCLQQGRPFERWRKYPGVLLKMKQELVQRADGMFRLAVCQLEILKSCIDIGEVEDEIKRLPRTLEGVYERILCDIREHHHTRVVRILQFLVYSERPLRIDELVDAIAVDLSREPEFEPQRRMPDPQGILEMCPSLLSSRELNTEENDHDKNAGIIIEVVELAHATVKEYLISLGTASRFYSIADPIQAQSIITTVCLAYLSHIDEKETQETTKARFPLAHFSSRYWLQYARGSDEVVEVREASIRFLSEQRTRHIWGSLYNPDFPRNDITQPYKMATPLYYASLAGLAHTVTKLLEMGADPMNADGGEYGNALQAACATGHEAVIKILLLERSVDVNRMSGSLGNVLQAASTQDNENVINMLLEKGAKLHTNGGKYGTALQAASARGNHGVVRLLLERGADPNLLGGKYSNALYVACLRGHEQIVKFLLGRGADPNAESPQRGIPLQAAVEWNFPSIIELLLDSGANIDKTSGLYGSTLQLACARGSEQIVRLLLEKGANPNQTGGLFGSALQAASALGDESLVRLLLDNGADPNIWGGYYKTSIQAASTHNHIDVIKLLIKSGIEVNAHDKTDEYAYGRDEDLFPEEKEVQVATQARNAHSESYLGEKLAIIKTNGFLEESSLVRQLLTHEAKPKTQEEEDLNQGIYYKSVEMERARFEQILLGRLKKNRLRDEIHSNALQAASAQGWTHTVALLLEASANVNTCQGIYGSPLQASSAQGHTQVVKLLLENGANPNKRGGFYGTPLQAASSHGHNEVVKLLLENWADPRRDGGAFDAPLPAAAAGGHKLVVEMLLQHRAYLNPTEHTFQRAVYVASARAYPDIVESLLERGAETDVKEHWYFGALSAATKVGHYQIVKMLLDYGAGINISKAGGQDGLPLHEAAKRGHKEILELLINAGADINKGTQMHNTPLCAAASGGQIEIIRLLTSHGAELNNDSNPATELLSAVEGGHDQAVALLLELGAKFDDSVLRAACQGGHETILRMLVRSPAWAETVDSPHENPLKVAASVGREDFVRLLLKSGVFPKPGALQESSARGNVQIAKMIMEAGGDINEQYHGYGSALQAAAGRGHLDLVHLLIDRQADLNSIGGEFGTALQAAVHNGHSQIVEVLLEAGANIDVEGGCRGSALQAAADIGDEKLVATLLNMGCQTINTNRGKYGSALQAAARAGHVEIVQLLLDHGADVNMWGGKYGSALRAAASKGHPEVAKLLLISGALVEVKNGSRRRSFARSYTPDIDLESQVVITNNSMEEMSQYVPADPTGEDVEDEASLPVGYEESAEDGLEDMSLSSSRTDSLRESTKRDRAPSDHRSYLRSDSEISSILSRRRNDFQQDCYWERIRVDSRCGRRYMDGIEDSEDGKDDEDDENLSLVCEDTESTLQLAVMANNEAVVRLLLDAGATFTRLEPFERFTELELRTMPIQDGIIELLLDRGADQGLLSDAVKVAAQLGCEASVRRLVQYGITHGVEVSYNEALCEAAKQGHEQIAVLLLENGASPSPSEDTRYAGNAFFSALWAGHESMCCLLLDAGADILSSLHRNAFHAAAKMDFRQLLAALLKIDMDDAQQERNYNSAFRTAASYGKESAMNIVFDIARENSIELNHGGALYEAAVGGDENAITLIVKQGAQFNRSEWEVHTAILQAMRTGDEYVAKMLLEACSRPGKQVESDAEILHLAAKQGFTRIINLLIDDGVDPETPSNLYENALEAAADGAAPSDLFDLLQNLVHPKEQSSGAVLQSASRHGTPRIVEKILQTGVNVNAKSGKYGTALQAASVRGNKKIVEMLVKAGADVNAQGGLFGSALQASARYGHARITEFLLKNGARILSEDENSRNALQAAARNGHMKVIEHLLHHGADMNPKAGFHGSAIQAAASGGYTSTVKYLVSRGADVNAVGGEYGSPLHAAARHDRVRTTELLLDQGALGDVAWRSYGCPLQAAIQAKKFSVVDLLLNRGLNVNVQGGLYGNALQASLVMFSYPDRLIEHGANVHAVGGRYGCPLQAAARFGGSGILKQLLELGTDPNIQGGEYGNPLQAACCSGSEEKVKTLLEAGAKVDSQGGRFESALLAACMSRSKHIIQLLLDHGADVNSYQKSGQLGSPLHAACFVEDEEVVELLLSQGANANFQFGDHGDALQLSCIQGSQDIIDILLDHGASARANTGKLGSALQAASWVGHDGIVKKLLDHGAEVNMTGGLFGDALQAASSGYVLPTGTTDPLAHYEAIKMTGEEPAEHTERQVARPPPSVLTDTERDYFDIPTGYHFVPRREGEGGDDESETDHDDVAVVRMLLESGANIQSEGGHFGSALQAAVVSRNEHTVKVLLDSGANVNALGGEFGTCLIAAATLGATPIVQRLLNSGADLNAQGGQWGTALISSSSRGYADIVEMLIEKGADVNAEKHDTKETALMVAVQQGYHEIEKMLLEAGAGSNKLDRATMLAPSIIGGPVAEI